jgi:enamine deaminase RidA (YjgF/YER057c/UK114 family)
VSLPINPPRLGSPRGYSNGMLAPPGSRLLCIAGQIAWNSRQEIVGDHFAEQFGQALANVLAVVEEAGGLPEHLLQLTIYVTDKKLYLEHLKEVGATWRSLVGRHYPAMALVEVKGLLEEKALVEIQALAALPAGE